MKTTKIVNIADLTNPETGNTYREDNLAKEHGIPVGALVELESGIRLHVVQHTRDCDGTPLYSLGISGEHGELAIIRPIWAHGEFNIHIGAMFHGYGEESLKRADK